MNAPRPDPLRRAWLTLVTLGAVSTAVAALAPADGTDRTAAGALVLVLALLKARAILLHYLGLAAAPSWRGGFQAAIALLVAAMLGLYLAA